VLMIAQWGAGTDTARLLANLRSSWNPIEGLARGFCTNLADPDASGAVVHDNYGPNLPRLRALKTKYDPINLFRLNANCR
jgi:hypothetical protein